MDLHLEEGERGREMGRGGEGEREDKGRGGGKRRRREEVWEGSKERLDS